MIDIALKTVRDDIQVFLNLKAQSGSLENKIILSPIADSGSNPMVENAISMSLMKIEEERINTNHRRITEKREGCVAYYNPPIKLNLYILFAAQFNDYLESLKFISHTISFFQVKPVFTSNNTPTLDPSIGKLSFEIFDQSLQDLSYLWGMVGTSYIPSVLYKMRMLVIQEEQVVAKGLITSNTKSEVESIS